MTRDGPRRFSREIAWMERLGPPWRVLAERPAQELGRALMNLVFPPSCFVCEQPLGDGESAGVCEQCRGNFGFQEGLPCVRCSAPLPRVTGIRAPCRHCRKRGYRFAETRALGPYLGKLQQSVLQMKHRGQEPLTLALGRLVGEQLLQRPLASHPDVVVPAPMHWMRRLVRGGNAPELLAEEIAAALRIPWNGRLVYFTRRTEKQGTLSPVERVRNVRRAVSVSRAFDVTGLHVLVVDDVMTTGATANEISKALLRRGARRVSMAVVARALG